MTGKTTSRIRLSPEQVGEMAAIWEAGGVTQAELAAHFGVSVRTVKKKLAEAGARKGRLADEAVAAAASTFSEAVVADVASLADRIKATREDAYRASQRVQQRTEELVAQAAAGGTELMRVGMEMRVLQTAMQIIERGLKVRAEVTGMRSVEDDEPMDELIVCELTADQVEEIRRQQKEAFGTYGGELDAAGDGTGPTSECPECP